MDVPNEVLQWKFGGASGNLRSDTNYQNDKGLSLYNETSKQFLIWKDEKGMNLGMDSKDQKKFHLHVPDGKERDIVCGESVSVANGGGKCYIHYYKQAIGINLDWSSKPHFEWRIFAEGVAADAPIPMNATCALMNEKVQPAADWLIHFGRVGGDIGWTTTSSWSDQVKGKLKDAAAKVAAEYLKSKTGG